MLSPNLPFKNFKLPNQKPETALFKVAILLHEGNRKRWGWTVWNQHKIYRQLTQTGKYV